MGGPRCGAGPLWGSVRNKRLQFLAKEPEGFSDLTDLGKTPSQADLAPVSPA
jgi:hypothetical protein